MKYLDKKNNDQYKPLGVERVGFWGKVGDAGFLFLVSFSNFFTFTSLTQVTYGIQRFCHFLHYFRMRRSSMRSPIITKKKLFWYINNTQKVGT